MSNSLPETLFIPPKARKNGAKPVFVYTGSSISRTSQRGHFLYVQPVAHDLMAGALVVYLDPQQYGHVVHRLMAAKDEEFVRLDDYNSQCDAALLAYWQVVGRVESAEFGGRIKDMASG